MALSSGFTPDKLNEMLDSALTNISPEDSRKAQVVCAEEALKHDDPAVVLRELISQIWGVEVLDCGQQSPAG